MACLGDLERAFSHPSLSSPESGSLGCLGAQSGKCPTLDLSSGLDIRVMSLSPVLGLNNNKKGKKSAVTGFVPSMLHAD